MLDPSSEGAIVAIGGGHGSEYSAEIEQELEQENEV